LLTDNEFYGTYKYQHQGKRLMKPDTSALMDVISTGQQKLLAHPVCKVFAMLKWRSYRKFWRAYVALNILFVVCLSAFQSVFHGYLDYKMVGNPSFLVCPAPAENPDLSNATATADFIDHGGDFTMAPYSMRFRKVMLHIF
jgi:hypothetical protein